MKFANAIFLMSVLLLQLSSAAVPQEKPEVVKKITPTYPRIYLLAGIEGEVFVHATIDENGKVEKVEVVKATDKEFGPAAVDAIKQWKFKPATLDGKPIKTEVTIPVKFRLSDAALPPGELVTLREHVRAFLEKGSASELLPDVDSSAFVVAGAKYELLLSILKDRTRTGLLSKPAEHILFDHLRTDATVDAAFMLVKTEAGTAERYHTIVVMKGQRGAWTIVSWHVSP